MIRAASLPVVAAAISLLVLTGKVSGSKVPGRMLVSGLCQVDQKFTAARR
ncbi:MAG: hypothetical protein KDB48_04270 [Solirubrobacterales bacterium]|nr:hypothetical protein [Solirubrobacterales bacterium]HMT04155.1 hypothetical protein [Solirubrobacterales bacterium]